MLYQAPWCYGWLLGLWENVCRDLIERQRSFCLLRLDERLKGTMTVANAKALVQERRSLVGRVAVVTGASSGVGRAIALALSREGVDLCLVGRDPVTLGETVTAARRSSKAIGFQTDLIAEGNLQPLYQHLQDTTGRLDILVHSAGVIYHNALQRARIEDFDAQYATNVRAPYVLTQLLLPLLLTARGQVVFINSSVGLAVRRPDVGQYAATKHALKAIADSLREEVNPRGVRVLSVYSGRTATAMQAALHRQEGRTYQPDRLLQPEDVSSVVVHALTLSSTAEITDISIRPMANSHSCSGDAVV
jgi:NADP-dependent 3-hydroxy acid dehydrogenase YdfG